MHACDSMAMLIGTAALCSEHLKRMAPGAGYHPAHRHRDRAQQPRTCAGPLYLKTAADGAFNSGRHAENRPCCAVSTTSTWPGVLDITLRTDTGSVLSSITPAPGTCILKLLLAEHGHPQEQRTQRARLLDLLHGLSSKSRSGVVEKLPLPDGTLCQLYLIPPSSSVAQRLGVEWAKDECLFGLLSLQRQH